jgi:hypothetical protein
VRLNVPGYLLRVVTVDSVVGLLPIDNILAEILVAGRLMKSGREHPVVVVPLLLLFFIMLMISSVASRGIPESESSRMSPVSNTTELRQNG